jgi:putative inorganic carbon (HCO3(-)) transporter
MTALQVASRERTAIHVHAEDAPVLVLVACIVLAGVGLALLPLPWLVTGLAGTIVLVLVLVRPYLALYLIAFAIPFGSLFEIGVGPISVGATEGLLGLMLAAWLARYAVFEQVPARRSSLAMPVVAFATATLYSLLNATSLPLAAKELVKWLEVAAVIVFVARAVPKRHMKPIVASLLAAGLCQAVLGIYQFVTQSGPEGFVLFDRFMRAYGTFQQPNPFAGYLGLVAPLALAFALNLLSPQAEAAPGQAAKQDAWPRRFEWFSLITLVVVSTAIAMSWSRGAWLGFLAAIVVVGAAQSRRGRLILAVLLTSIAFMGLLAGTAALPRPVAQRLTGFLPFVGVSDTAAVEVTDENYAALERLAHWQSALEMWRDHPWLGIGFGNYAAAYSKYALAKWPAALGHAHNYYLNIAAETGLLGLVAYLLLWGVVTWRVWRIFRGTRDPNTRALALGALGMLVHVSVHNVVDNLWVHNMYIHVAIILGLLQGSTLRADQQEIYGYGSI